MKDEEGIYSRLFIIHVDAASCRIIAISGKMPLLQTAFMNNVGFAAMGQSPIKPRPVVAMMY
jgi:hypothetical protein